MNFLQTNGDECSVTALDILSAAFFFKGMVFGQIERDIPETFIIMADDQNNTFELITTDNYIACVLSELEESINEKGWRPIAIEFCEDDEDFTMIDLHYFGDPSEKDIALINSMFTEDKEK